MNPKDKLFAAMLAAAMLNDEHNTEEEKRIDTRKQAEDLGSTMYQSYLGFKDAGFTDEQAFQIVLKVVGGRR